jgi:hypothetical protein
MAKNLRTKAVELLMDSHSNLSSWERLALRTTLKTKIMFYGQNELKAIVDRYDQPAPDHPTVQKVATARSYPDSPAANRSEADSPPAAREAGFFSAPSEPGESEIGYADKFKAALRLAAQRPEVPLGRHIDDMLLASSKVVKVVLANHPEPSPYEVLVDAIAASTDPADQHSDYVVLFRKMLLEAVHHVHTAPPSDGSGPSRLMTFF